MVPELPSSAATGNRQHTGGNFAVSVSSSTKLSAMKRRRGILIVAVLFHRSACVAFSLRSHQHHHLQGARPRSLCRPAEQVECPRVRHGPNVNTAVWTSYQDISTAIVKNGIFDEVEGSRSSQQSAARIVRSPLGLTMQQLSEQLEGSGRAAVVWDCIRAGVDPNLYYGSQDESDSSDNAVVDAWLSGTKSTLTSSHDISSICLDENILGRRQGQGLGAAAWEKLQGIMQNYNDYNNRQVDYGQHHQMDGEDVYTIENSIASLSHMKVSPDGTTKLLLKMKKDGLEVESVIIPWMDKGFSTLCVSSQVGCRQGCTFCATGRMGKLRSLTSDEILVQVYYASKVCRVVNTLRSNNNSNLDGPNGLPKVDNIVFMGMGEPADNADAVVIAANALADRRMFGLAQSKVTISTVAPDPSAFVTLGQAPAALAWSVHAVDDSLRRSLVPTTKYSMEELRLGLVQALSSRSNKLRRTMLEVALIEGVNDSDKDAERLAEFSQSIMEEVVGSKVVVNLIPYNAIDHPTYRTPSMERVLEFQKIITDRSVLCYVRTTRGDEESAACGQLATKKKKSP